MQLASSVAHWGAGGSCDSKLMQDRKTRILCGEIPPIEGFRRCLRAASVVLDAVVALGHLEMRQQQSFVACLRYAIGMITLLR